MLLTDATSGLTTGTPDVLVTGPDRALITPRGPFSLAATRDFVGTWEATERLSPGVRQPLRLTACLDGDHHPVAFAVADEPSGTVEVEVAGTDDIERAVGQLARMLSLDHNASDLPGVGERVPAVGALMTALPGLRPTLFASPYEAACWAVLSLRISMRQASGLHRRLTELAGPELVVGGGPVHAFPSPEALLAIDGLPGLPDEKLRRLHGIADAALAGDLDVHRLRALGPDGARAALRRLRGIGEFWAAGIWLRGCGVVDEFPTGERRACAALARLHGRGPDDPIDDLVESLRPYRLWVALLLRVAAGRGLVPA